jgi:hypothetical protein
MYRIKRDTTSIRHPDDCIKIQSILNVHGCMATMEECQELWERHSEDYCAGWLMIDSYSDENIWNILLPYLEKTTE